MPEITTTATTDTARVQQPDERVTYVREQPRGTTYVVEPQAPTPRDHFRR